MLRFLLLTVFFAFLVAQMAGAIVKYDEGRMEINGIQLFQDSENARAYYYLPPYPRVSVGEKGEFEFLCMKLLLKSLDLLGGQSELYEDMEYPTAASLAIQPNVLHT